MRTIITNMEIPKICRKCISRFTWIFICLLSVSSLTKQLTFTDSEMKSYRNRAARMFQHAYNGYLEYAYPYDELRPLTCDGQDTWGSYSLTLIDALDTLAIMGNYTEFQRVSNLLLSRIDFDRDINVSVFETNIRVVGGLLSAHLLSHKAGVELEVGWPCTGPLLTLAERVARKLLPAFNTTTGMPYGTVNLLYGVPTGETPVTCTAGVGTFLVEFGALSRLTGDPVFEDTALRAMNKLWELRSSLSLVGNHIDVMTGKWTAIDSGIGAGVDSYFEYLVKGAILFENTELMSMFNEYFDSIERYLRKEDWFMWANMNKGTITLPVFQSLEAFWPGILALIGELDKGVKTIHNYHQVWKQFGFTPEFYNIPKAEAHTSREGYPLRPELIESTMYLYRATKDPFLLEIAVDILESIEQQCRTKCGYATVKDVRDHRLENRMESFFLSETIKYLYLIFDQDSFIHNTGGRGTVIDTPNGQCVIDAGGYVFNTEAHPVDVAALYCCGAQRDEDLGLLQDLHDSIDLIDLFGSGNEHNEYFMDPAEKRKRNEKKIKIPHLDNIYYDIADVRLHERGSANKPRNSEGPAKTLMAPVTEQTETKNKQNTDDPSEGDDNVGDWIWEDQDTTSEAIEVREYREQLKSESTQDDSDFEIYETRLLTCPAQPFRDRLSVYGELFEDG